MTAQVFSDEPTRVAQLVNTFFADQTGSQIEAGQNVRASLSVGADARDDCAVYDIKGPCSIVLGSDYIRGSKFRLYELGLLTNYDIGYYLVAANVSDVAAMGATPLGVVTVIRYPDDLDDEGFSEVLAGIHRASTDFGTLNVGGDIGQAERVILSGAALGICEPGKVLKRSGAKPGDVLCVTGPCGALGAAVAYFPKKSDDWSIEPNLEKSLIESWKRPQARVAEGRLLSSHGLASSCQDTSDGLKATIEQLAEASNVGFEVRQADVPIDPAVTEVAKLMGVEPIALALSASADFQLAFTVPADYLRSCREEFATQGLECHVIGRAVDAQFGVYMTDENGDIGELPGVAWRHQKSDISDLAMKRT